MSLDRALFVRNEARDGEEADGDEFCEGCKRVPYAFVLNLGDSDCEVDLSGEQENDDQAQDVHPVFRSDRGSL